MSTIETQDITETKLRKIALISSGDPHKQVHSLMHHYNLASLKKCFKELGRNKSPWIDGIKKEDYEKNVEAKLQSLLARMKSMSYRPGRGRHDAVKDLREHLFKARVQVVIDVDIKNFFGTIDHKILIETIREKIKDTCFIRYLVRTLKSGVLTGADLIMSDEGVAQGSFCSSVLTNIFAHYVIDKWFEEVVKPRCKGTVALHRYCDDCVVCCSVPSDAPRILKALENRLRKFGLQLNVEKTKIVRFSIAGFCRGEKQQTFDFLGFTFYIAPTRRGIVTTKVKTSGKRIRAKLKKVKLWCKQTVDRLPLHQIWKKFCIKIARHIRYYGVSYNHRYVGSFVYQAIRILFKWLNRRSQRKSYTWEQFGMFKRQFPAPEVKLYHCLF